MSLEIALREDMAADPVLTALVPAARIYGDGKAPQDPVLPYITFDRIGTDRGATLRPVANGIARAMIQVDAWTASGADRIAITRALRQRYHPFRGTMGASAPVEVRFSSVGGPTNSFVQPRDADEVGTYRGLVELRITYVED